MKRIFHSLRLRLGLMVGALALCLMLFSVLYFHFAFTGYLERSTGENVEALLSQTTETLDYSFSMLENTMTYFFSDATLTDWFSGDSVKTADAAGELISKVQLDESLKHSLMLNSAWQNNLMDSAFFIVDKNSFSFYSQGKLPVFELTKRCFAIYDEIEAHPTATVQAHIPRRDESLFFLSRRYPNDVSSALSLVLIVAVDEDTLFSTYNKVYQYPGSVACIVDENGVIYSAADKSLIGTQASETVRGLMGATDFAETAVGGDSYYALCSSISGTGLSLCIGVPKSSIGRYAQSVTGRYTAIMIVSYCVMLLFIMAAMLRGTRFLTEITASLKRLKQGDFSARMPAYSTTELSEMSGTFNDMADRIDHLINEVYEQQIAVNKANIKYLQSQINPHFLFNALAAIGTKAKLGGDESVYTMVHSVSMLLQAGMSVDEESLITVAEEIEYINCYMTIQRERFGEKLQYEINVTDDALLQATLPRLCLEPIVENAVVHGLEVKRERGTVTLEVLRDGSDALFIITDDGVGFRFNPIRDTSRESIGLRNTDRRLRLIYGEKYGVEINERMTVGAQVTVRIPLEGR